MLPSLQNTAQIHFPSYDTFPAALRKNSVLPFPKHLARTMRTGCLVLCGYVCLPILTGSSWEAAGSNAFRGNCLGASCKAPKLSFDIKKYKYENTWNRHNWGHRSLLTPTAASRPFYWLSFLLQTVTQNVLSPRPGVLQEIKLHRARSGSNKNGYRLFLGAHSPISERKKVTYKNDLCYYLLSSCTKGPNQGDMEGRQHTKCYSLFITLWKLFLDPLQEGAVSKPTSHYYQYAAVCF